MARVQSEFSKLATEVLDPLWAGKPNAWIRGIAPSTIGKIGERLAHAVLGGRIVDNNRSGYDLEVGELKIEVKLSTLLFMSGYPIMVWRQIRPSDPYTHILFIAVYPENVRMFLVPREEIPPACLKHQHGRGGSLDIFQVHTRRVDELFPWMVAREIA